MQFTKEEIEFIIDVLVNLSFKPGQSQKLFNTEQMIKKFSSFVNAMQQPQSVPEVKEEVVEAKKPVEKKKTA